MRHTWGNVGQVRRVRDNPLTSVLHAITERTYCFLLLDTMGLSLYLNLALSPGPLSFLLLLLFPPFFSASAVSSRFPAFTLYLSRPISSVIVPPFISSPLSSLFSFRRRDPSSYGMSRAGGKFILSQKIIITIKLFYSCDACLLSLFESSRAYPIVVSPIFEDSRERFRQTW